jgi:hypothetical protein
MRKLVSLFMLLCVLTGNAQTRKVRVVMRMGSEFVGTLKEFKIFEHVLLIVDGKEVLVPYGEMAYMDDIVTETKTPATPATPVTPVIPETPETPETPESPENPENPENPEKPGKPAKPETPVTPVSQVSVPDTPVAPVTPVASVIPAAPVTTVAADAPAAPVTPAASVASFKGFLLDINNNVYLHSSSTPVNKEFDEAGLDVLKRLVRRYGFWHIVDKPEDAHFSINYVVTTEGKPKVGVAISSLLTGKDEVLGEAKLPEDIAEFRKQVWELYNKHILPLQKKIEKGNVPSRTKKDFTVE